MLIAFFADIHANRQAFSACLDDARQQGAQAIRLLGDYVGYGADPEWAVATVMDLVAQGALAVLGNHDAAVGNAREQMSVPARMVIEWTRGELGAEQRQFLAGLPLTLKDDDRLLVHSEASNPARWTYVESVEEAARSLQAGQAALTLCGHIHRPALYCLSATAKMTAFTPTAGVPVKLLPGRKWLAVLGAVGQPRDGNPQAAYVLFDTDKQEITYRRVSYDAAAAAAAIRAKKLPTELAERLLAGR